MRDKVYCPVCRVSFLVKEPPHTGETLICPVCGAKLTIAQEHPLEAVRSPQKPEEEILERVENYARLRGYVFDENKQEIVRGLLEKNERFGDFYCPCRFDNIPENICPCLETRQGYVNKEGSCL
ncbi:ferredoxin-thioredoxin reductase catalytic domain-containing protein [Candidatus Formimonas warabiya]|uniref:ferredoxin-thioredoxin reductase catalytic domain-containing protein n=1 Tax=Formimonas warabiya TaxID=1761012 RepID=UPI0011D0C81A|nr:ferredoxin-thioredoxin reductase catalytic domain-containing protein [Candidatus Formimonas warabiya]